MDSTAFAEMAKDIAGQMASVMGKYHAHAGAAGYCASVALLGHAMLSAHVIAAEDRARIVQQLREVANTYENATSRGLH